MLNLRKKRKNFNHYQTLFNIDFHAEIIKKFNYITIKY